MDGTGGESAEGFARRLRDGSDEGHFRRPYSTHPFPGTYVARVHAA